MWQAKFVGTLGNSFKYYIICIVLGLAKLNGCIIEMKNPHQFVLFFFNFFSYCNWFLFYLYFGSRSASIFPMASMSKKKASSSSSIYSSTPQWKYDVFLSFGDKDTLNSFTNPLYDALERRGIVTFRDGEKLEIGKSISSNLLKGIEESRFAIVILSRNYASSTQCLDELTKIIGCMKDIGTTVLPIFMMLIHLMYGNNWELLLQPLQNMKNVSRTT